MTIAIVQSTSGSGSGSGLTTGKTLTGAPTAGNLLIFAVNSGNSTTPTTYTFDASKWFIIDVAINPGASDQVITLLGRYVQGGDTATMPAFCTAGSGFFSYEGYEISGVTGTFATDFLCSSTNQIKAGVNTISTFKQKAIVNGSLGLVFYAKYNESSAGTAPSGWTSDINTVNSGNYGSFGCAHLAMNAGDSAQATFTAASSGSNTFGIIQVILTPSQPAYPIVKRTVQRVGNTGFPGALFFGGTPFAGDIVRAYIGWHDGTTAAPTTNTGGGWVNDTNALNGSNPIVVGQYRYAVGGDTNTLPALCTAGSTLWNVTLVEIGPAAALSGTFATDRVSAKSAYQSSGATLTTTSDATTTNSSLCTTGFTEYNATTLGSNTGADQNASYLDNGDYGWWAGSAILNATSGTACQTVWTLSSSSDKSGYIQDIWKGTPAANVCTGVLSFGGVSFNGTSHEYAAKTLVVTSGTTLTVPADWNNLNNSVEALGAAGNSAAGIANTSSGATGGSGGYSKQTNIVLTPGSTVNIQVGVAGNGTGTNNDTYLRDNSNTSKVLAQSGASASTVTHGNGGQTGRAIGSTTKIGQNGANGASSTNRGGPSGASPPGPLGPGQAALASAVASGAGAPGADNGAAGNAGTSTVGGLGGVNDAGTGAGLGATSTTNAGDGVDGGGPGGGCPTVTHTKGGDGTRTPTWTDTASTIVYGPGSPGAGGGAGGNGGNGSYGASGGGGGVTIALGGSPGTSGNGLLVLKWVPAENAVGALAFSGVSFSGTSADKHTAVGSLAFGGISFAGVSSAKHVSSGALAFTKISFNAHATSQHTSSGALAFSGISFAAIGRGFKFVSCTGLLSFSGIAFTGNPDARDCQMGLQAITIGTADARNSQMGLAVLATPSVNSRVCQMGLMVLATGGEIPPKPSPLTLMDAGRTPVMKQRLVNMYAEPTPQGPGASVRYQRPGLYSVVTRGEGPIRASFTWNQFRVTVSGGQVWIDANNIGLIPANGLARYAFSDEELVIISNGQAYYVTTTDVTPISDPDLPDTLVDVLFLAGRFVYVDGKTSQFLWSELGDAQNIDGLSFATVAENTADKTVGAMVFVDNIVFFTGRSIEWWYPADDPDAPFQRSQGRKNDRGLAAQATMTLLDNGVFFLGEDRIAYRTGGAVPIRVSDFTVEDEIRRVAQDDLPNCSAFGIVYGGHTFFVLHLVGRGTWALDVGLKAWAEWKSWNHPLFRVTCCDEKGVAGDRYSGQLMGFNGGVFTDVGDPIERIVSSFLPLKTGSAKNFNLALDCARGVGLASGYGSEPVVEMRYTDHESRNWTPWEPAPLGVMGDATDRAKAIWTQLGAIRAPGRLFEFRCTDPVQFAPYQARFNEVRP